MTLPRRSILVSLSLLVLPLFFGGLAGAADSTDSTDTSFECTTTLMNQGSSLLESYSTFLNEYFQADKASSDQLQDAMMFYRYVEDSLYSLYADNATPKDGQSLSDVNSELTFCRYVRDQYLAYAKVLLTRQMQGSSVSKTTFKIVDGLKAMNEDLRNFSGTFQRTFPMVFNKMDNGLTCYPRDCVTQ